MASERKKTILSLLVPVTAEQRQELILTLVATATALAKTSAPRGALLAVAEKLVRCWRTTWAKTRTTWARLAAAVLAGPHAITYSEAIDYAIEIERLDCTLRFDEVIRSHVRSGRLKMRRRP